MLRSIVFDMGNVLIRWDPDLLLEQQEVPPEDRPALKRAVFGAVEWTRLDRGTISKEEALSAMCRELPERLHASAGALVYDWWKKPLVPVPGMENLIAELSALGYGIYLLSNASSELHQYFHRIPGSRYFNGKIVSADWKLLKPQREIYETLFREYGLKPEECFFIDDLPFNVEGAQCAGMGGAVFDGDLARLRRALRAAGVPVSEGRTE